MQLIRFNARLAERFRGFLPVVVDVETGGFNADRDLAANDYTQRGFYLRLRFKFDETLFKSGDREINRSLDR